LRQADRVEDDNASPHGHETSRVLSKTIEREDPASRPHAMREALL
jgi:hypothetical protein